MKDANKQWWLDNADFWLVNEHGQIAFEDVYAAIKEIRKINPKSVLDLGCGTGRWSMFMPEHCNYVGIDISPRLIEVAKERYSDREFKVCDFEDIDKLGRTFDLIFTYTSLITIPSKKMKSVAKKIKQIGKKGLFIETTQRDTSWGDRLLRPEIEIHKYHKLFNLEKQERVHNMRFLHLADLK